MIDQLYTRMDLTMQQMIAPSMQAHHYLLPFDILVHIVEYHNLKDSFSFSLVCIEFFDAVYYVYAHRTVLDFSPYLECYQDTSFIPLPDNVILQILHSHTRVQLIACFHLSPVFVSYDALQLYFNNYLDFGYRGHVTGQLCLIYISWKFRYSLLSCDTFRLIYQTIYRVCRRSLCLSPVITDLSLPYTRGTGWSSVNLDESEVFEIDDEMMMSMEAPCYDADGTIMQFEDFF